MNTLVTIAVKEPLQPVKTGIWRRRLVDQPSLELVEMFFDKGIATAAHGHGSNEAVYQVAGRFELAMGGQVIPVGPGDSYFIPAGALHSVVFKSHVKAVDVFEDADRYRPAG